MNPVEQFAKLSPRDGDILVYRGPLYDRLGPALDMAGVDYSILLNLEPGESLEIVSDDQLKTAGLMRIPK